jgi:actin-related protein 9
VGLRLPRASSNARPSDYLVGPALEEAERSGEALDIIWPLAVGEFVLGAGKGKERAVDGVRDWAGFEALLCACAIARDAC